MTCNNSVYLMQINSTEQSSEKSVSDEEEEEENDVPEVLVDASGHPILPSCPVFPLKSQQSVVCEIFSKAYCKFNFLFI